MEQQKRDSWKPRKGGERRVAQDGREYTEDGFRNHYGAETYRHYWEQARVKSACGLGDDFGPNADALRNGKRSRFSRHMQLVAGSKTMAELILYTGRYDPEFLNRANQSDGRGGAPQPAATDSAGQRQRKREADWAKYEFRKSVSVRRRLLEGKMDDIDLDYYQLENLKLLEDGTLLERRNAAVAAYGHGTLRNVNWPPSYPTQVLGGRALQIGGSTGGATREILDGYTAPDVDAFMQGR